MLDTRQIIKNLIDDNQQCTFFPVHKRISGTFEILSVGRTHYFSDDYHRLSKLAFSSVAYHKQDEFFLVDSLSSNIEDWVENPLLFVHLISPTKDLLKDAISRLEDWARPELSKSVLWGNVLIIPIITRG